MDATGWSGHADAQLSSLGSILNAHQLGAVESDVVDVALAAVHENLKEDLQNAHGTGFQLDILNSRDHADPWGDPNVSRVIIGGTREEAGVDAVGFAESVDVGNFNLAETAIVLLDILVSAWHDLSPRRVPVAAGYSESEVIGRAIGTVASHEAGHLFATFHTGQPGLEADLMRAGWDPYLLMGMGPDGVLGTADDQDVDFVESRYYSRGPFTGLQDAPSAIRHGARRACAHGEGAGASFWRWHSSGGCLAEPRQCGSACVRPKRCSGAACRWSCGTYWVGVCACSRT